MTPRVIKTPEQHKTALAEVERLVALSPSPNSRESEELELLATLIEMYEKESFPIERPTALEAIQFRMEEQGLRQRDLIPYIGSKSKVSELLSGKRPLTLAMIRSLSTNLGIPADILLQEASAQPASIDWTRIPLREMARRGWISATTAQLRAYPEKLARDFFEPLGDPSGLVAHFRRTVHHRSGRSPSAYAVFAWAARVLMRAREMEAGGDFNRSAIDQGLLTETARLSSQSDGPLQARDYLSQNGILLIIEPHLPRTYLDGAALLSEKGRPIVALTIRHDRLDNFWFSLLHELAHVLCHLDSEYSVFVDDLEADAHDDRLENEADRVAAEALIPRAIWRRSSAHLERSATSIKELAAELRIHPCIVAGRIRRESNNFKILSQFVGTGEARAFFSDVQWA